MSEYQERAAVRSGATVKAFDAVVRTFLPNPSGEALFAARFGKSLVRRLGYGLWVFPKRKESGENRTREMCNLIESRP